MGIVTASKELPNRAGMDRCVLPLSESSTLALLRAAHLHPDVFVHTFSKDRLIKMLQTNIPCKCSSN